MQTRSLIAVLFITVYSYAGAQCFLVPSEVCVGDCGPLFYLQDDPPGTTYQWSISCGTITNDTSANPHVVCFNSSGTCTIEVVFEIPGELPDTCRVEVSVLPPALSVIAEDICEGDSIEINGTYYSDGFYSDTLQGSSINGCDSILFITVNEIPNDTTGISYLGCEGDGFSETVNGIVYNESNPSDTVTMTGSNGCDSVIIIDLIFLPPGLNMIDYDGCEGDSFSVVVNNVIYSETNPTGTEILVAANGCDSIVTINLIFHPTVYDTITYHGCTGDGYSIVIDSIVYDEDNPFGVDTLPGGCDTIITIDLSFDTLHASLALNGNQLCASPSGLTYTWMTCDSLPMADTTDCLTLSGTGCVCVIVSNGICSDTVCQDYTICELTCNITAPAGSCVGDSVLLIASSNGNTVTHDWTITFDSLSSIQLSGDSILIAASHSGEVIAELKSEESGCVVTCIETLLFTDPPLADLCCTERYCDSAVLTVHLFGQPPFTLEIFDGASIDTVSDIMNSQFEYTVNAPFLGPITLLSVLDSSGFCAGGIINDSIHIEVVPAPDIIIEQTGNTLCIQQGNFSYNWTDCSTPATLAPGRCFTPDSSGCYCAHISTGIIGCSDMECIDFVLTDIGEPEINPVVRVWYDVMTHTIQIILNDGTNDINFQLYDLLGRELQLAQIEQIGKNMYAAYIGDHIRGFVIASVSGADFRYATGIVIPE